MQVGDCKKISKRIATSLTYNMHHSQYTYANCMPWGPLKCAALKKWSTVCNSDSSSTGKLKSMFTNLCFYLEYCKDMLSVFIKVCVLLRHVGFFCLFKIFSETNEGKC